MPNDHIRCYIGQNDYGLQVAFYLVDDYAKKFAVQGERGLQWLDMGPELEMDHVLPLFTLPRGLAMIVLPQIAEALDRMGVKPPDAGVTAGKLEAQTAHLNDLRTMLGLQGSYVQPLIRAPS